MSKYINKGKESFLKQSGIKKILILGIVLAIGWGVYTIKIRTKGENQVFQSTRATRQTVISSISLSGKVETANMVEVTTDATGVVKTVYAKDGDFAAQGQKIAEITLDREGQQKNAQAWAGYLSAKNSRDASSANLYTLKSQMFAANQKFMNDAVERDLSTSDPVYIQEQADWLAAEAKYKNQQSVMQQTEASIQQTWLSFLSSSQTITAPAAGTLQSLTITQGMTVTSQSATSTTTSSKKIAIIQTGTGGIIAVNGTEIDIPKIRIGQKATVTLDSLTDKTFSGEVVARDQIGETNNNVTTYMVIILLDTSSPDVLPNMAATASIILDVKNDALVVPSTALQVEDSQTTLRVLREGREEYVTVQTGISDDTQTEILSGIDENDEIITGTQETNSQNTSRSGSVFSTGGFGGGAFRPGGFGGSQRR